MDLPIHSKAGAVNTFSSGRTQLTPQDPWRRLGMAGLHTLGPLGLAAAAVTVTQLTQFTTLGERFTVWTLLILWLFWIAVAEADEKCTGASRHGGS